MGDMSMEKKINFFIDRADKGHMVFFGGPDLTHSCRKNPTFPRVEGLELWPEKTCPSWDHGSNLGN